MPWNTGQGPRYGPPPQVASVLGQNLGGFGQELQRMALQQAMQERMAAQDQRVSMLDQREADWRTEDQARQTELLAQQRTDRQNELARAQGLRAEDILRGNKAEDRRWAEGIRQEKDQRKFQEDLIKLQASLRPKPQGPAPSYQVIQGEDGLFSFDQRTGQVSPVAAGGSQVRPPAKVPGAGPRPTEVQTRIQVATPRAKDSLQYIENYLTQPDGSLGSVPEESFLGRALPGRYLQGEEVQRFDQAADAIASAILRVESGAAITENELENYKRQFIPRPGDKPETIQQKLGAIKSTLAAMDGVSGAAPAAGPTVEAAGGLKRQRVAQLKAQGVSQEEARAILRREGLIP